MNPMKKSFKDKKDYTIGVISDTHGPLIEKYNGVLYLNPGTAGQGSSEPTVALMNIEEESVDARLVKLV